MNIQQILEYLGTGIVILLALDNAVDGVVKVLLQYFPTSAVLLKWDTACANLANWLKKITLPKAAPVIVLFLLISGNAFAQTTSPTDIISEIVATIKPSEGVMYGVREHQIKDITSFQIIGYQSAKYPLIALDANFLYAPSNLLGGSIAYPIGNFSSITGINTAIPILSWLGQMNINVGYGFGWFVDNNGTRTNDSGPVITGNIKF